MNRPKFILPQKYFSKIMRAIIEFELISPGDSILIGLSGGKDSLLLTYALAMIKEKMKNRFSLAALTIDPAFNENFDSDGLKNFCARLGIPFWSKKVDVAGIIKSGNESPCFTCSFFRRGAINSFAKENGFSKIAYAHHNDDAVETFLMSILYSGQIQTFAPKTFLTRTGLTVIRPLVYLRESETSDAVKYYDFAPIASPCPYNGLTARQKIKELIAAMERDNPLIYQHLASAMRAGGGVNLWPPEKKRSEMKEAYLKFAK